MTEQQEQALKKLREPFPKESISKLPKPTKAQTDEVKADYKKGVRCDICGAWHHPKVVHIDYVGHAALTDRLLSVDPLWNWEPLAVDDKGLPLRDNDGGMWIKLTVCGITRLGYGDAEQKKGPAATKEVIGDSLRNAAMRFGCALDLWHKGDLPSDDHEEKPVNKTQSADNQNNNETQPKDGREALEKWKNWVDGFAKPGGTLDAFTAAWDKYFPSIKKLPGDHLLELTIARNEMITFLQEKENEAVGK